MAEVNRDVFKMNDSEVQEETNEPKADHTAPVHRPAIVKKSMGRKFLDLFFDETPDNLFELIVKSYISPGLKKLLYDVGKGLLEQSIYPNRPRGSRDDVEVYNNSFINARRGESSVQQGNGSKRRVLVSDYKNLLFENRDAAEKAIIELKEILYEYHEVTANDLFQTAEVTCDEFSANDWGWTNLDGIDSRPDRNGWRLILPRIKRLR